MPVFVLIVGILLVIAGLNDRLAGNAQPNLVGLLKEDFKPSDGSVGFAVWILAIVFIGAIGYVKQLKPISNGFFILLFLGIFLTGSKGNAQGSGFFANLTKAFSLGPSTNPASDILGAVTSLGNATIPQVAAVSSSAADTLKTIQSAITQAFGANSAVSGSSGGGDASTIASFFGD